MTKRELDNLVPRKSMVYSKKEGKSVQWMFMGINPDGKYQLCGLPFGYEKYLMIDCFEVVK